METSSNILKSLLFLFLTWVLQVHGCQPMGPASYNPMGPPVQETPVVRITGGKIVGRVGVSRSGEKYHAYLGIPYAKPPLKKKRFQPPKFYSKTWKHVRPMKHFPEPCLQFDFLITGTIRGSEDCLYLNVFKPEREALAYMKHPVLVHFNGGLNEAGDAAMFNPKYLMDENIVVVTVNYRLGVLGFLASHDKLIQGNMGLKDQVMALEWVQKNIAKFGGDPLKVTIYGQSSGASNVHLHVISPRSAGLFSQAITSSGNVYSPWAINRDPKYQFFKFLKKVDCDDKDDDMKDIFKCLRRKDPYKLVKYSTRLSHPLHRDRDVFSPVVEFHGSGDEFLAEDPIKILESGRFNKVPMIMGVNSGDGTYLTSRMEAYPKVMRKKFNKLAPKLLRYDEARTDFTAALKQQYFNGRIRRKEVDVNLKNITQMITDFHFFLPIHKAAQMHAKHAPVRLYLFAHMNHFSTYPFLRAANSKQQMPFAFKTAMIQGKQAMEMFLNAHDTYKEFGAGHGDELTNLWYMNSYYVMESDYNNDYNVSKSMVDTFTGFVSQKNVLKYDDIEWPAMTSGDKKMKYLLIHTSPAVKEEPFEPAIEFLLSHNINYREKDA